MQNVDISFNNFSEAIINALDKHLLYQKVKRYTLKLKTKPLLTVGLQISLKIKK